MNVAPNKKNVDLSDSEVAILRDFVEREVENIKVFGPADGVYQKNIDSLKEKLR